MSHDTGNTPSRTACAACRARIALTLARSFTRVQVAQLLAAALATSETVAYAEGALAGAEAERSLLADAQKHARAVPVFTEQALRLEGYRVTARREFYAAAVHPWHGDHPGGPVPVWDATQPDPEGLITRTEVSA